MNQSQVDFALGMGATGALERLGSAERHAMPTVGKPIRYQVP